MNGISSGRLVLKTTRPTVVSTSFLLEVEDLGVRDVLIVELLGEVHVATADAALDRREQLDLAGLQRDHHFIEVAEDLSGALRVLLGLRQVVAAEHEILEGTASGLPCAGERMLFDASISTCDST
jgi:hypothetical protein